MTWSAEAGCTRHACHGPRALRPRHSVVSQWDVLLSLGIAPPDPEIDTTEMPEDPAASAAVVSRLADAGVSPLDPMIIVHVSAGNPFRRWPSASFVDLVCRLVRKDPHRRVILTSGPSDAAAASSIAAAGAIAALRKRTGSGGTVRRVQPGRTARADRARRALHRRR